MTLDQALIITILFATIGMFLWGRWRYDMVAVGALLACVLMGLVPAREAFRGFSQPAVITVITVLILGSGLQSSGAVDVLARLALPRSGGKWVNVAALTAVAALLSSIMNNVGTLALLMPVAVQTATRQKMPPGKVLMPVAFGSILGGMTTLIGTPSNIIVSSFRVTAGTTGFSMFDFAPVGIAVALGGILFILLFSRWLVPTREIAGSGSFDIGTYLTEARVGSDSKTVGMTLRDVDKVLEGADAQVIGLIRGETSIPAPSLFHTVRKDDILIIEAEPAGLATALSSLELKLEEAIPAPTKTVPEGDEVSPGTASGYQEPAADKEDASRNGPSVKAIRSDEILLMEFVLLPRSQLVHRSASTIRLRTRFGVNMLAISRQGRRSISRLRNVLFEVGDVLLLQGTAESLNEFATQFDCAPLAERPVHLPDKRVAMTAGGIMALAVGGAAIGLIPAAIAFTAGVLAMMAFGVITPRSVYNAVDWPVVVLLGALLPVAGALGTTGSADLIAKVIVTRISADNAVLALSLVLIVTTALTNFMNNAATAAVMSPIAIDLASHLQVSSDPFLMAVAVGASCAFLTPIGHQNNALILGPGGFRFGDYWRLGLPLQIIVFVIAVPLILTVWPF
ncbi:MAG: SLC13 family permease [Alphaproteobacteria bacterium]|nr:SLC13 family permease [Alphaproteobacteria bacterium]